MSKVLMGRMLAVMALVPTVAGAARLNLACGSVGQEQELCRQGAEAWARQTGNEVSLVSVPTDAGQQLTMFQQLLAAGGRDIDVFRIDVVWPGIVGPFFIDLRPYFPESDRAAFFPALMRNNTVDGRLVAIPWFMDAGLLYYRKDLLEKYHQRPPETWQALAGTAKVVLEGERRAGQARLTGFVFQGKAYEGLTCNALEWVDSFGGGTFVDAQGQVTLDNPRAVEAVSFIASLMGNVVPRGVLSYEEEGARGVFQSGNAVFMRNWPYAWALANSAESPVRGKVGVMALPRGGPDGRSVGTLGGWQLGVSRFSAEPELAVQLVKYLTSAEEQKRRALVASFNPTRVALYRDPDILRANPFMGSLEETFASAVARPTVTGAKYNQVSADIRNAVHATLSGRGAAQESLQKAHQKLVRLSRGGRW
ncbi:ABC transporter substrate-binding protein [Corallococcus sp. H22C18031201]|nr:ABC transporter substrate-binding protein [Corallococcus sp. H22C18031201]